MLFISGMLGRGTLYVTSSTIVDVIETIGCFVFLDVEGDGPVCLTCICSIEVCMSLDSPLLKRSLSIFSNCISSTEV